LKKTFRDLLFDESSKTSFKNGLEPRDRFLPGENKMSSFATDRASERGSAAVKFVLIMSVILLAAHAGFNYVPVAYDAESLKSEMQSAVLQGIALPGKANPVENVKARIQKSIQQNDIPVDAMLDVKQNGNSISARVAYTKDVNLLPFGIYRYNYRFDYTATPTGFLLKQ
jgi:hypothetical protein